MKGSDFIENSKNIINHKINIDKLENKNYNLSGIEIFTFEDYKKVINILEKYYKSLRQYKFIEQYENKKQNKDIKLKDDLYKNENIQYIEYEENVKIENSVSDNNTEYVLSEDKTLEKINNSHDKIFRTILNRKKDACYIIKKALTIDITEENIERYNSSFITKLFENRESDIVYKLKSKEVYFIIEHQTKIDYSMPLRMLEYKLEVMRCVTRGKNINNKNAEVPIVIPIVLYTGHKKWDAKLILSEIQPKFIEGLKDYIGYNLIDVNNYTDEELLENENFVTKAMLIEKTTEISKLIEVIYKINKKLETKEDKELLENIVRLDCSSKLGNELAEKIIKDLKGDDNMLASAEMVAREVDGYFIRGKREGRKEGKRENMIEIAKRMLEKNMEIDVISDITKLDAKEIKKIKI